MTPSMQIFTIIILVLSASFHEYMHAWAADQQGDHTARDLGRLTINPLAHLDWFGSVFLPLMLVMFGTPFVFGYAKPVPFNPYNLKDAKWGSAKVAVAGPFANLLLAVSFGLIMRFFPEMDSRMYLMAFQIVIINLVLMVFNLIPVPPLDGSKILMAFLPYHAQVKYAQLEPFGMMLVLFIMLAGIEFIWFFVSLLFRLIVGG